MEDRRDDIERGMAVIPTLDEIMADDADPTTRRIYQEIQQALRVPFVNFIFRMLANRPAFFQAAWARLHPIAQSRAFEDAADRLRTMATIGAVPVEGRLADVGDDLRRIRAFAATIHHVVPKLLLAATAFDLDAAGERAPDAATGSEGDLPDLGIKAPGMVEGATSISMVDPKAAEGPLAELFQDIQSTHGHPGVATYYRALAQWPELLDDLWQAVRPVVGSAAFEARRGELVDAAAEEIRALRSAARANGLMTDDPPALRAEEREELRAILAVFRFRIIPDLNLVVPLTRRLLER
ncbi:MAG: halocarboxylic acid dehydrogenase DehI family protein [Geminicoccaceae bacterium]|nr:halocarboxylic acid dehydrogenase DehI family protein [Geminicoccaceae bacterium]